MNLYKYDAIDGESIKKGQLYASTKEQCQRALEFRGYELLSVSKVWFRSVLTLPVSSSDLCVFTHLLAQLLQSGFSIVDALKAIQESQDDEMFSSVLMHISIEIESGRGFSNALKQYEEIFSPTYISMIEVAEVSGAMPEILFEIERMLSWQESMKNRIKKVMFYPVFSAIVLLIVIIYLMVYLVPNLTAFIATTGFELPWYTDLLLGFSSFIGSYYIGFVAFIIIVPLIVLFVSQKSLAVRFLLSKYSLKFPIIGLIIENSKLSRLTYTVGMMYVSGVPLIQALDASKPTLTNLYLQNQLVLGIDRIKGGETIALGLSPMFEAMPVASRIIALGEVGGVLDSSLIQLSDMYNDRVYQSIERFEALIGPTLIIVIGSLLIWVIVAVIGPIYDAVFSVAGGI